MPVPPVLRPDSRINQHYLNMLREQTRRDSIQASGHGLSIQESPGGLTVGLNPDAESYENCRRMKYTSAAILEPGSLVHVYDGDQDIPLCALTDYSGRCSLGILREGAKQNDCPWVQYQGAGLVLWDMNTLPADWVGALYVSITGQRLGARQGSAYAQFDLNGPLLIERAWSEPIPEQYDGFPVNIGLAKVRFEMPFATQAEFKDVSYCLRAGVKLTSDAPLLFDAPYRCIVLSSDFHVTDNGDGDISI